MGRGLIVPSQLGNVKAFGPEGYRGTYLHLRFIVTKAKHEGKEWIHASVSREDKLMPTYDDLILLKNICIGPHRWAYQVFPPKDKHINIAKTVEVLHLWSCDEGRMIPDFGKYGTI